MLKAFHSSIATFHICTARGAHQACGSNIHEQHSAQCWHKSIAGSAHLRQPPQPYSMPGLLQFLWLPKYAEITSAPPFPAMGCNCPVGHKHAFFGTAHPPDGPESWHLQTTVCRRRDAASHDWRENTTKGTFPRTCLLRSESVRSSIAYRRYCKLSGSRAVMRSHRHG